MCPKIVGCVDESLLHGRRNRGGTCSLFFIHSGKCPFSCNLVALLKNFENAKMNRKMHVSGDFRRSKFQNFAEEQAPD